jgi:hypothetical protein
MRLAGQMDCADEPSIFTNHATPRLWGVRPIQRKEQFFATYRRNILDFEVTDLGSSYHISVVSSADPVP